MRLCKTVGADVRLKQLTAWHGLSLRGNNPFWPAPLNAAPASLCRSIQDPSAHVYEIRPSACPVPKDDRHKLVRCQLMRACQLSGRSRYGMKISSDDISQSSTLSVCMWHEHDTIRQQSRGKHTTPAWDSHPCSFKVKVLKSSRQKSL